MIKSCVECSGKFNTLDDSREYCSGKCRQRRWRRTDKGRECTANHNLKCKVQPKEWECFRCGGVILSARKRVLCDSCIDWGKKMGYKNPSSIFSMRRWLKENPEKAEAYKKVGNLQKKVGRGTLEKEPCDFCGTKESVDWHHHNYRKALDLIPLCRTHHHELHSWDSN